METIILPEVNLGKEETTATYKTFSFEYDGSRYEGIIYWTSEYGTAITWLSAEAPKEIRSEIEEYLEDNA